MVDDAVAVAPHDARQCFPYPAGLHGDRPRKAAPGAANLVPIRTRDVVAAAALDGYIDIMKHGNHDSRPRADHRLIRFAAKTITLIKRRHV